MTNNEFLDKLTFEVFDSTIKEPLERFTLTGLLGIRKIFDKDLKTSVYQLEGSPNTTKISIPKELKHSLSLIQTIIVFQLYVKFGDNFSLDLGITDILNNKRHLSFSTIHKDFDRQPLIARIPLKTLASSIWTNLIFDLSSLTNDIWKNQTFKTIDSISICANCKLRKVFTMKNLSNIDLETSSLIQINFPKEINHKTMIFSINQEKIKKNNNLKTVTDDTEKLKKENTFKIDFVSKDRHIELKKQNWKSFRSLNSPFKEGFCLKSGKTILKNKQIEPLSIQNIITESLFNQSKQDLSSIILNETRQKSPNENKKENNIETKTKIIKAYQEIVTANLEESQHILKTINEKNNIKVSLKTPHPPIQFPSPIKSKFWKKRPKQTLKIAKYEKKKILMSEETKNVNNIFEFKNSESNTSLSSIFFDDCINRLTEVLKTNSNTKDLNASESCFQSHENLSEFKNIDNSGKTIIYSFSSKPKPVSFVYKQLPYLSNNNNKTTKVTEIIKSQKNTVSQKKYPCSLKNSQLIHNLKNGANNSNKTLYSENLKTEIESKERHNVISKINSPDFEYFEAFQRGLSDLTNPSDEIQVSEKYNFDALTSSIEETSTSCSKKTCTTKLEEANNYQEEMNISILSNLPIKSINYKDFPSKYSPISNLNQNEQNKTKTDIILEDSQKFDYIQAQIDEINSYTNEEIDLLYDPTLNCYYDPKKCKYYELNLS